jgi:8-oxo-dGTP diphosphatase
MINVSAAVIVQENKILICQRPEGKNCALLWEFPGGKIEAGETAEVCVIRECQEELGIEIEVQKSLGDISYKYPDVTVHIQFFICKIIDGEIKKKEHKDIKWILIKDLSQYDFCPADKEIIKSLENIILNTRFQ